MKFSQLVEQAGSPETSILAAPGTPLDDAFFCGVIPEKRSEQIAREERSSPSTRVTHLDDELTDSLLRDYSPNPNKKKRKKGRR